MGQKIDPTEAAHVRLTMVFYLDRRMGDRPNTPSTLIAGREDDVVDTREIDIVRFVFR